MSDVKPVPDNMHTVTPYLCVKGAAEAIEFYKSAFGATETMERIEMPGGLVGHAELRIGDSVVMLSDEFPDYGALSPATIGGSPIKLSLTVEDPDAAMKRAIDAGATEVQPMEKQFYGWRMGAVADPFGFQWSIGAMVEEVSDEEMKRRAKELFGA